MLRLLFYNKKSKSLKFLQKGVDKSQKVNYYIVKVERTKGQRDKEIYNEVIVMGILADRIEQFILEKLLEEQENGVVLRRNELADELNCAPSQISYVLSTRFSNDRGFTVESRRGLGGFISITRIPGSTGAQSQPEPTKAVDKAPISMGQIDHALFVLMKQGFLKNREAILLHESFVTLMESIPDPAVRDERIKHLFDKVVAIVRGDTV